MECDTDFTITNVSTVDDDDDEPLLEVTKVTVLKEKRQYSTKVRSELTFTTNIRQDLQAKARGTKYKKICYVPLCPNTSISTPEKMFITVPVNPVRRKMWLDVVGKTNGKNPKSPMFCCQDHFDLEKDMKNYEEHLKLGRVQMLLYQTVVPHTFICNGYGHLKRPERVAILRELHEEKYLRREYEEEEDEEDDEEEVVVYSRVDEKRRDSKLYERQRTEPEANESGDGVSTSNKSVFIEMPSYEFEDQSDFIKVKEIDDTIVIDDSDDETC